MNKYSCIIPLTETLFLDIVSYLKESILCRATSWGYEIKNKDFVISIYEKSSKITVMSVNNLVVVNRCCFSHITKEFTI